MPLFNFICFSLHIMITMQIFPFLFLFFPLQWPIKLSGHRTISQTGVLFALTLLTFNSSLCFAYFKTSEKLWFQFRLCRDFPFRSTVTSRFFFFNNINGTSFLNDFVTSMESLDFSVVVLIETCNYKFVKDNFELRLLWWFEFFAIWNTFSQNGICNFINWTQILYSEQIKAKPKKYMK